jgi:hypothetical protein
MSVGKYRLTLRNIPEDLNSNTTTRISDLENEDYSFLGCDGLSFGGWIPEFLRNLLPPALGYKNYLSAEFRGTIFKKSMILMCDWS